LDVVHDRGYVGAAAKKNATLAIVRHHPPGEVGATDEGRLAVNLDQLCMESRAPRPTWPGPASRRTPRSAKGLSTAV